MDVHFQFQKKNAFMKFVLVVQLVDTDSQTNKTKTGIPRPCYVASLLTVLETRSSATREIAWVGGHSTAGNIVRLENVALQPEATRATPHLSRFDYDVMPMPNLSIAVLQHFSADTLRCDLNF